MLCCCKSFATHFVGECEYLTEYLPHYFNLLATLLQTVSSRRGPIYRALISVNIHKMTNRNVFAMKRICVFDDVKIRIWQCKDTGTMNRSLRLTECTWCISWANVDISQNVCNLFFICMLHNCHTKVWLLPCKSMVFAVQKGGFYNAKSGF